MVLPLYPQYSCSTVAAVWDELARILAKKRAIPGISFIRDYAEHPDYIHALAASVRASFAVHGEPDLLLLSYHGIPQRYANRAMIILSAVAIRRGNWFPRWGCRRSG